jgi:GT2 family glycosyltransferase
MDLSILIVNWKSASYLRACLASIYRTVSGIDFEVVVVDNASYDGCATLVETEFPQATFVQSENNLGFARANNLAFQYASGDVILLLNPDTELIDDSVTTMLAYLRSRPRVGAVGCCLLNSDLSLQVSIHPFPTIWNRLFAIGLLREKILGWRIAYAREERGAEASALPVDILGGACIMVRRTVFETVGMFSDGFYMFGDDVDLCYKITKAGYPIHYIASRKIIHHGGASTAFREESHFSVVMQMQTMFKFFHDTRGPLYAALYRAVMATAALLRLLCLVCLIPFGSLLVNRDRLLAVGRRWSKVLGWAIGMERWAETTGAQG